MKNLMIFIFISFNVYGQEIFVTDLNWPIGIVENNNFLFIAESDGNEISKIDLNSPNPTPITVVSNLSRPNFLEIDGDFLYFSEYIPGRISKIDITQIDPIPITLISGLDRPEDIVILGDYLYYAEFNVGTISKIDITHSNPVPIILLSGLNQPYGLDTKEDDLYFSEYIGNKISKIDLLSTNPTVINVISDLQAPIGGIKIYNNDLYFFEYLSFEISIMDVSVSPPVVSFLDEGYHAGEFEFVGNDLYVSNPVNGYIIKYPDQVLSVNSLFTPDFTIFPNPSNDFITVIGINEHIICNVYNALGVKVQEVFMSDNFKLDIRSYESGFYFLVFENGVIKKIIKK